MTLPVSLDNSRPGRIARLGAHAALAALLVLSACAVPPAGPVVNIRMVNPWKPSRDVAGVPLSTAPQEFDFTGLRVAFDGQPMTPGAALRADSQMFSQIVALIGPDSTPPIPGTVRIVLPDHDRLRATLVPAIRNASMAAADFNAESQRISLHAYADILVHSRVFGSATVVEQNDTQAPGAAGADYVVWYRVFPVLGNVSGVWAGMWDVKRGSTGGAMTITTDPGVAVGLPRYQSWIQSLRSDVALEEHMPAGSKVMAPGMTGAVARAGTGIVVDTKGDVLTNNHVVAACPALRVVDAGGASSPATLVGADAANDLALVQESQRGTTAAVFRDSHGLRPGEPVVVTGYPLSGLVSQDMAVSTGSLTAMGGLAGDTRQIQISAPIQPGNSGSPVLDESGHVIGITSSVLNVLKVAMATGGALPENVNFAIKTDVVKLFLDSRQVPLRTNAGHAPMSAAAIGEAARRFTVKIECLR